MTEQQPETLPILYQDELLVAVNKPSGLLVHRSMIDRRETRFAMKILRDQLGRWVYPIHRLDKPTSGILLFALDPDTARLMGALFESKAIGKRYLAVVRGYTEEAGVIDYPLKEQLDRIGDRDADKNKAAQAAVTEYRRLATVELPYRVDRYPTSRYSLVELTPRTGRKHQLRRHLKHIAHPIVGDTTHGKSVHNRLFQKKFGSERLLLSATEMRFTHPLTGLDMLISAPLDVDFSRLMRKLGWNSALPAEWLADEATL